MADDLIDSRGYFWPADMAMPEHHFAHPAAVPGRLRITANGSILLDLDAHLPDRGERKSPLDRVLRRGAPVAPIAGILAGTDERVWLNEVVGNGASLHTKGPSSERFFAHQALVSSAAVWTKAQRRFTRLELPLEGFEEWVGLEGPEVNETRRTVQARYVKTPSKQWRLSAQTLEFSKWIQSKAPGMRHSNLSLNEQATLKLIRPAAAWSIDEAVTITGQVEDLLILLTDSNLGLAFPRLRAKARGPVTKLYYPRLERGQEPVTWHRSWVTYPACRDDFGSLIDRWLMLHREYGPGIHLYLGNRRGPQMYAEHQFASLVWGIEAFHRTASPSRENAALEAKITRILDGIPKAKDRQWAERMLRRKSEPALADRIAELVTSLGLNLAPGEVQAFAARCGQRRNDLSHFGGSREHGGDETFTDEIKLLIDALSLFHHALLLKTAGLPDVHIHRQFRGGTNAYRSSKVLEAVGIRIDPDALP